MKRTVVLGASAKPERYSHQAVVMLANKGHEVYAIGRRKGLINDMEILEGSPVIKQVETVTMYLSATNQKPLYEYILSLKPKRIIFNPGAENPELAHKATEAGILVENACTLVLLRTGQYALTQ